MLVAKYVTLVVPHHVLHRAIISGAHYDWKLGVDRPRHPRKCLLTARLQRCLNGDAIGVQRRVQHRRPDILPWRRPLLGSSRSALLAGNHHFPAILLTAPSFCFLAQTNNLEWYDPAAITTKNGALEITLSAKQTHGLNYQGGLMSTWNKFCFTGGLVLVSVSLPGANNVAGLWPAVWSMGNLGENSSLPRRYS